MSSDIVEMEESTLIWTVEPKPDLQGMTPVQQLKKIKPKYNFEKAALTLQNSKGLLKNLKNVLSFLKSQKEYLIFSSVNGASEIFFVDILKDRNNLLSNLLDDNCKAVCKDIYDFLNMNDDKFEVFTGFRQQVEKEEMTLIYYKNFKFTSEPVNSPVENNKAKKLTKTERKMKRMHKNIACLTKPFLQSSLCKVLDFLRDCTQASLIFNDLNLKECNFIKSISAKSWTRKVTSLEPDLKGLMQAIFKILRSKKNWTLSISESKVRQNSLRDVTFNKKPNISGDIFREPNALDILSEDVLKEQSLPRNVRLMVDLSTPVVSNNALKIMKVMGWEGGALGIRGNGITEPIMPQVNRASRSGLGLKTIEKTPKKKYVPTNFLLSVFEKALVLITTGDDEITLSSDTRLQQKDRGYLSDVINKLNKRDESAVGYYGDKYLVMKILQVMVQDPSLRLVVHLYNDKIIKIIRAQNMDTVPIYSPGSNITDYVDILIKSFGPVFIIDRILLKRIFIYEVLTLLLDLVLNDCETKTYISPNYLTPKDMKAVLSLVNHVNMNKKRGGSKIEHFLIEIILINARRFSLHVDFEYLNTQHSSQDHNIETNKKNSFTIKKIHNKNVGLYENISKQNTETHKATTVVDEESYHDLDDDDDNDLIIDEDFKSDQTAIIYEISDSEIEYSRNASPVADFEDTCNEITIELPNHDISRSNPKLADDKAKKTVNNNLDKNVKQSTNNELIKGIIELDAEPSATSNKLLLALNSAPKHDIDIISRSAINISPLPSMYIDDSLMPNEAQTNKVKQNKYHSDDTITQFGIDVELIAHDEPSDISTTKSCMCKSRVDHENVVYKETQTDLINADDERYKMKKSNSDKNTIYQSRKVERLSTMKSNSSSSIELDLMMDDDDLIDYGDIDSQDDSNHSDENAKYNSTRECDQLQQDIYNLQKVLEKKNSLLNRTENAKDKVNHLKRGRADLEKNKSPNNNSFIKTIKIVPLNYPNESIDKKTVSKIHNLIMEAITETEKPLLKCHGVKDGALLYTCFTEDSCKFLNKLLINTKTKIVDEMINERKPKLFMRCVNYLELSYREIFSKLELYNENISTTNWKVERCWENDNFSIFVLQMDQDSFDFIKCNGFSLFFGVDQAEFNVAWRENSLDLTTRLA